MAIAKTRWLIGATVLALLAGTPALADVRDGVEAWSRGDYAGAIGQWQAPAEAGDPDAMFNLAQAYRLGRGVPRDEARAEALYARAAEAGHLQAADTYGLMLFQDGRREQALPYVEAAARRGDPRSQYLLGIAHFNGDLLDRDWVRAYALVTLAHSAGLPQAAPAVAQMDEYIPLPQREQGAALAGQLRAEAESARAVQLASADLGRQASEDAPVQASAQGTPRVPRPIATTAVSPSVAAAREAIAAARRATGTERPEDAGATFAEASPVTPPPAARATPTPTPSPAPTQLAAARPAEPARPAPAAARPSGPWRVQLGAFGVPGNAERLWARLSARSEIAGRQRLLVPAGRVTKLQAGGYASQAEAQAACNSLKRSGQDCLVTRS